MWFYSSYAKAQIYWDDCYKMPHNESDCNRALQLLPLLAHVIPELELDLPLGEPLFHARLACNGSLHAGQCDHRDSLRLRCHLRAGMHALPSILHLSLHALHTQHAHELCCSQIQPKALSKRMCLRAVITSLEDCGSQYWAAMGGRLKRLSLSVSGALPPNFTEATGKLEALRELTLGPPYDPPHEEQYPFCPSRGNLCLRLPRLSILTVTRLILDAVELDCPKLAELHLEKLGIKRLSGPGQALRVLEVRHVYICIGGGGGTGGLLLYEEEEVLLGGNHEETEEITECELFARFPLRSWHGLEDLCIKSMSLSKRDPSYYGHYGDIGSLGDLSSLTGITSLDLSDFGRVVPSALPTSLQCLALSPGVGKEMIRLNPACWPFLAGSLQLLSLREFSYSPKSSAAGFWQELTSLREIKFYGPRYPEGSILLMSR